jgi:hypothetical protein
VLHDFVPGPPPPEPEHRWESEFIFDENDAMDRALAGEDRDGDIEMRAPEVDVTYDVDGRPEGRVYAKRVRRPEELFDDLPKRRQVTAAPKIPKTTVNPFKYSHKPNLNFGPIPGTMRNTSSSVIFDRDGDIQMEVLA